MTEDDVRAQVADDRGGVILLALAGGTAGLVLFLIGEVVRWVW